MPAPQLADRMHFKSLLNYVDNDDWSFEQKLDGERLMIACVDGTTAAFNRKGEICPFPKPLLASVPGYLKSWTGEWLFDGEYIDSQFWAFDLPIAPVDDYEERPYYTRREVLTGVTKDLVVACSAFNILPYYCDPIGKRRLMKEVVDINAEGIVAKQLHDHKYAYGKRVPWMLKAKLWASADVIVSKVSPDGKQSVEIQVFYQGRPLDVGSCKVSERVLDTIQVDDVIEVKYLYATKTHKLYQPSLLRVRTDKSAKECTLDQLKPVNKQILT